MTAQEPRHATVGYSEAAVRSAVSAGLLERPLPDAPVESDFPDLVTFWLTDPDSWDWFPPPLPDISVEAICRRLLAGAN